MTERQSDIEDTKELDDHPAIPAVVLDDLTAPASGEPRVHPLDVSRGCAPGHPDYIPVYLPAVGEEVRVPYVSPQDEFAEAVDMVTAIVTIGDEVYLRLKAFGGLVHPDNIRTMRPVMSEMAVLIRSHGEIWAVIMVPSEASSGLDPVGMYLMTRRMERQPQLETLSSDLDDLLDQVEERTSAAAIKGVFSFHTGKDLKLDLAYVRYFLLPTKREIRSAEKMVRDYLTRGKHEAQH